MAVLWNISLACNRASADFMITSPLMDEEYQRLLTEEIDACGSRCPLLYREQRARGIDLGSQRARRIAPDDCRSFDYVLTMDEENYQAVATLCRESSVEVRPFLDYASKRLESEGPDPFYDGLEGFEHVLDLVEAASEGLLKYIRRRHLRDGCVS